MADSGAKVKQTTLYDFTKDYIYLPPDDAIDKRKTEELRISILQA